MNYKQQRKLLIEQQRREQAWSARQAQRQMDFQREMSSTAHQREVSDLQAAGLNPVLSSGGTGAQTGNGAMAESSTIIPELAELIRASNSGHSGGTKVIVQQKDPEGPKYTPRTENYYTTSAHSHTSHGSTPTTPESYSRDHEDNVQNLKRDIGRAIVKFRNEVEEGQMRFTVRGSARASTKAPGVSLSGSGSGTANQMIDTLQAFAGLVRSSGRSVKHYVQKEYHAALKEVERNVNKLPEKQQKAFWYDFYRG